MNKTANNRTNSSKQTGSPGRDTTYSARYKATRRDALQSAKVRSNENVSGNVIGRGRPSSFPSESALPELKKSQNVPRLKNTSARQSRNDNQPSRNSERGSVTSYKPKVSPEPSRRVMSNESVRQETRSPSLNHTSQSYRDVRAMENGYSNQLHPQNGDNRNNRNARFEQNDNVHSRGIPNGDIPRDQHNYQSSNRQYDYMKPFVGTYPESNVARGSGQSNRTHNQIPEHAQNEVYAQKASFYDPRVGNGVQQEPSIQQGAQHHAKQEYGEYYDRRVMQPPVQRSPKNRQQASQDTYRTNNSNYRNNERSNQGNPSERSNDRQNSETDRSPPSPRKRQNLQSQSDPNQEKVQVRTKDNKVQYVIRNRSKMSNPDDPIQETQRSKISQNNESVVKNHKPEVKQEPKINSKGYDFPEVADVDDFSMEDVGDEYEGNDVYLCYLKTDAGDVIGPLRLDIEDVQLGLPKFDQDKQDQNQDKKDQNQDSGMRNRQTGSHGLNEFSSRSHSMLTLTVDTEQVDPDDENLYLTKRGKLTFVDLAGSEKVKDSGSSAEMLIESNNINRSLLVLGNCISSLGDPKKRQGHIPYRDSKLTKLLADSLGGNGVTLMIACVTPSAYHVHETTNTLRYASRAKRIKSKPVIKMDPREKLILSLKREIKILRNENHYLREQLEFPAKPKGDLQKNNDEKFMKMVKDMQSKASPGDKDLYAMLQEYMIENEALRNENSELHRNKDQLHRDHQSLSKHNERLQVDIEKLQRSDKGRHNNGEPYRSPQNSSKPPYNPPPQRLPPNPNQGYVSPTAGRGKPPPSHGQPKRPPHRLSEPLMRPAQLPPEHLQNGYVEEGYMSPRGRPPIQNGGMRQESPMRLTDSRRSSQSSTADTIKNINEKLKQELYDIEGQINHHHLVNARTRSVYGSQTSMHSVHR
ncbi:homeobox protein 2-like isoform X2 [Mytilus californianus]|uniref:homeobox protein 2-like isoform X2 n=1 Tax=Mytilus californianus TaxID=6549 RepID=UPI0022457CBF|nr:homeobox protein 2-like isoform X2 [Mytilus californianus]